MHTEWDDILWLCGWYVLRLGKFGCLQCNIAMITVVQLKTSSLFRVYSVLHSKSKKCNKSNIAFRYCIVPALVPALGKCKICRQNFVAELMVMNKIRLHPSRFQSNLIWSHCCNYCWHGSQNKSGLINSVKCTIPRINSNLFFVELFLIQPKCPFFVRNREINTST